MTNTTKFDKAMETAITRAGGITILARAIGSSATAVCNWRTRKKIPVAKCVAIEQATGVSRRSLCPEWRKYWPTTKGAK
jgi:DNA-binding transcriptional regulator YdaS (Cro superfamily)